MKNLLRALVALFAVTLALPASAQQTYTSRAAFNAATNGRTIVDFNAQAANTDTFRDQSYTEAGVNFTVPPTEAIYTIGGGRFPAGVAYGSGYLEWQGATQLLTVDLPTPATALGFNYIQLFGNSLQYTVTVNGAASTFTSGASANFFGTTATTPFTTFTISGSGSSFPTIDNLTYAFAGVAAVPEPTSWALLIGGFGAAGGILRRRRRVARALLAAA